VKRTSKSSKTVKQGAQSNRLPVSVSGQITLLTDFGTDDYFVGAMKGVILSAHPNAELIDITHNIPPHDIQAAAFTLLACYRSFAQGTIHLAIVDPGVGSTRRPILAVAGGDFFVGPDNGILSYVLDTEPDQTIFHITSEQFFRKPLSTTFHGRDVFAPVAAALSTGLSADSFGPKIDNPVKLSALKPVVGSNGKVRGRIIHIDRFGNCVTNIERSCLSGKELVSVMVKGKRVETVREFYGEAGADKKPFTIWGSAGFLEVAARDRSAAKVLGLKRGDEIALRIE
jgi:S-adenosylmethionine hydrolase